MMMQTASLRHDTSGRRFRISDATDREEVAQALAAGAVVAYAFANFYVITTRPEARIVRGVNLMKGRDADQTGSVTTTREHVPSLFDWSRLPDGLSRRRVIDLMDALWELGPFGFRGPAAAHMPPHLTQPDGGLRTTQVITPGLACPSNAFIRRSLDLISSTYVYGTSANRSRHLTGAEDEPVHYRADAVMAEFGNEPGFILLRQDDDVATGRAYPLHAPQSTTILAFHKLGGCDDRGRQRLIIERHGSLDAAIVRDVA